MEHHTWYFLLYRLPAQPSTLRVSVWRKLKLLGGLYIQQSVCVLPVRETLCGPVAALVADMRAHGGEVDLFSVTLTDADEQTRLIERFHQHINTEYTEVCGRCRALHTELAAERAAGNLTFAELDENDTELTKLRAWLVKIRARDWFDAPGYAAAVEHIAACEEDFERFSQQVYAANGLDP